MRPIDADALIEEVQDWVDPFVLTFINNAQTVDLKDIYQEGHYDGHLEGYIKAINEERPQCNQIVWEQGYEAGYAQGYVDGSTGADMRGSKKETTFDDYLKEQLKDPEFRKEWDKLCDDDMQKGDTE